MPEPDGNYLDVTGVDFPYLVPSIALPTILEIAMKAVRLAAFAGAVCLLAGGCSHSASSSPAGSGAAASVGSAAAGNVSQTAAGSDSPAAVAASANQGGSGAATCKQLSKAEVQPLQSEPITAVNVAAFGSNSDGQQCTFVVDGGAVTVIVVPESDQLANYAAQLKELAKPVSVPGVGDEAVRDGGDESGAVLSNKGGATCQVGVSAEFVPGVGALMEAAGATNNIGDSNYAVIAAAAGTLCNRIFGSGNTTPDLSGLKQVVTSSAALPTDFSLPTDSAVPTS